MENKKQNILVFPCGSEVGLEIYRSLHNSIHFNIIGANSVDDHGKFVFENYIGGLPFIHDETFITSMKKVVKEYNIDAIYPAMDSVIVKLKQYEKELNCKIIASPLDTTKLCLSKFNTYNKLQNIIKVPKIYTSIVDIDKYPVFLKPDVGYGSRGVLKANKREDVQSHIKKFSNSIILEYLPGKEYTIDCFTDYKGDLLFVGSRERKRISNGISVNTKTMVLHEKFKEFAALISASIKFEGAWFFQLKENDNNELVLMEIASRIAGSSAVYRVKGINFAMLSIFSAFNRPISILENSIEIEMDRSLNNKYKLNFDFEHVYVDFDDTIIIDNKVNNILIGILYKFANQNKKIYLITKHLGDIHKTLKKYKIAFQLFDHIIHLDKSDEKYLYIEHRNSIFIDDSFAERREIQDKLNIPVFSMDSIEVFI